MVKAWAEIELHARAVIDGRAIVRRRITRVGRYRHPFRIRVGLAHVEINPLGDVIFRCKEPSRAKDSRLDVLIGGYRQGSHNVVKGAEVMKRSIFVAKDLQVQGSIPDNLAVGLDPRARGKGLDHHIISNRAVRTTLCPGRRRFATGQKPGGNQSQNHTNSRFHLALSSPKLKGLTTPSVAHASGCQGEYWSRAMGKIREKDSWWEGACATRFSS